MCISRKELDGVVAEYKSIRALIDEANSDLEKLKDQIKDYLTENELNVLIGNDYKITLTQTHRMNWDTQKLNTLLGDTVNSYKKPSSYPQLRVS